MPPVTIATPPPGINEELNRNGHRSRDHTLAIIKNRLSKPPPSLPDVPFETSIRGGLFAHEDGDETQTSDAFGDLSSLQTDVGLRALAVIRRHEAGGGEEEKLASSGGDGKRRTADHVTPDGRRRHWKDINERAESLKERRPPLFGSFPLSPDLF